MVVNEIPGIKLKYPKRIEFQKSQFLTIFYHKQSIKPLDKWASTTKFDFPKLGDLISLELSGMFLSPTILVTYLVQENSFCAAVLSIDERNIAKVHLN